MDDLIAAAAAPGFFISHNLGVVREFADRVYVIYRGRIVGTRPRRSFSPIRAIPIRARCSRRSRA